MAPAMQDKDTSTLNHPNLANFLYAIRYVHREQPPFFLIALPFPLIGLAILIKLGLRKHRYYKTLLKDKKQQVIDFCFYYLKTARIN